MSLIWIHEDAITLDHPVFAEAQGASESVFIWDSCKHDRREYSFKRRVFIYECAHDLGVPIYIGKPFEVLTALAGERPIYAAASPDPYIKEILARLESANEVNIVDGPHLAKVPANTDTGRFFRFWNRARASALTHSSQQLTKDVGAS